MAGDQPSDERRVSSPDLAAGQQPDAGADAGRQGDAVGKRADAVRQAAAGKQQPDADAVRQAAAGKQAAAGADAGRQGASKPASQEGLRYRKKLKARLAVERAGLELVIERGYDVTTVEDICARAEISKKTFFNYFPSKAAAIMGRIDTFPEEEALVEVLEQHEETNYLDLLVGVVGTSVASGVDEEIVNLRRAALRSMPQLFFEGQRDLLAVQQSIAAALRRYLAQHPERRMLPGQPVEEESLVASSMSIALARTRSMLHVCGNAEPSAAQTRRLVVEYLGAGEGRRSREAGGEAD